MILAREAIKWQCVRMNRKRCLECKVRKARYRRRICRRSIVKRDRYHTLCFGCFRRECDRFTAIQTVTLQRQDVLFHHGDTEGTEISQRYQGSPCIFVYSVSPW